MLYARIAYKCVSTSITKDVCMYTLTFMQCQKQSDVCEARHEREQAIGHGAASTIPFCCQRDTTVHLLLYTVYASAFYLHLNIFPYNCLGDLIFPR